MVLTALRGQWALRVLPECRVRLARLELLGLLVLRATLARKDLTVSRGLPVRWVRPAPLGRRATPARQVLPGTMALTVSRVLPVLLAQQEQLEPPATQAPQDLREQQEALAHREWTALMVRRASRARRVPPARRGTRALRERKGQQERLVHKV